MSQLENYLIYAVHYSDEPYRKHITRVKLTHFSVTSMPYKNVVVDAINEGKKFYTYYRDRLGEWQVGKQIIVEIIDGESYIKTERNGIKADNLGNLIKY